MQVLSDRPVEELYEIFEKYDTSGDGQLDEFELKANPLPQKALCGGIPSSFLEPSPRSWSHFVGIYRQKLTKSSKNDF